MPYDEIITVKTDESRVLVIEHEQVIFDVRGSWACTDYVAEFIEWCERLSRKIDYMNWSYWCASQAIQTLEYSECEYCSTWGDHWDGSSSTFICNNERCQRRLPEPDEDKLKQCCTKCCTPLIEGKEDEHFICWGIKVAGVLVEEEAA